MFTVTITEKTGKKTVREFDQPEVSIGRVMGNDVVLPKANISKRHARIVRTDKGFVVIDAKSTNGTFINGRRIAEPYDLAGGDKIFIGEFALEIGSTGAGANASPPPPPPGDHAYEEHGTQTEGQAATSADGVLDDDAWGGGDDLDSDWSDDWDDDQSAAKPAAAASAPSDYAIPRGEPAPEPEPAAPASSGYAIPRGEPAPEPEPEAAAPASSGYAIPRGEPEPEPEPEPAPEPKPAPRAAPAPAPVPVAAPAPPAPPAAPAAPVAASAPTAAPAPAAPVAPTRELIPIPLVAADPMTRAAHVLHHQLWPLLQNEMTTVASLHDEGLRRRSADLCAKLARQAHAEGLIDSDLDLEALIATISEEAVGLGPLGTLWADVEVTEILVSHPRQILVERRGQLERSDRRFSCDAAVAHLVHRLLQAAGKPLVGGQAVVETRLADGLSVAAVLPPLAVRGPTLSLRRVAPEPLQVDDLVAAGTLTAPMADFLETAVQAGMNIVVSGSRGAGKTTTLNVLAGYIPTDARIVTVEERAELSLEQEQVVSLEARARTSQTGGVSTVRELLAVAQRLHPSRLILGECRGPEGAELLKAMAGGTEGVLTSVQAAEAGDALTRLETMLLWDGIDLPQRVTRQVVSQAVNLVVEQTQLVDGTRRITRITEVQGVGRAGINLQDLFVFEQDGIDDDGRVIGRHKPTGTVPGLYERLRARGVAIDTSIFEEA